MKTTIQDSALAAKAQKLFATYLRSQLAKPLKRRLLLGDGETRVTEITEASFHDAEKSATI